MGIQRKHTIAVLAVLVCLAVAVWFLLLGPAGPFKKLSVEQGTEAVVPSQNETRLRNATRDIIPYLVKSLDSGSESEKMSIVGGELDTFSGNSELEITFWQNEKEIVRKLEPGKSYAFRYDEKYQLNIFEVAGDWYPPVDLAPDVSTPMVVVEKMLEMAEVDSSDVVYDLGSGDGRIVITAAKKYGARGVGIDIDNRRILESRANAKKAGVENLVEFRLQDITEADFSEATVVTLYLLTSSNVLMLPFLESQIKPGSYVVSHNYKILGWEEKEVNLVMLTGEDGVSHSIYLYRR